MRKIGTIGALIITAIMTIHRFTYPDMTDTRWLITYWYIWLVWFIGVVVIAFVVSRNN